jgi:hypothetical protein
MVDQSSNPSNFFFRVNPKPSSIGGLHHRKGMATGSCTRIELQQKPKVRDSMQGLSTAAACVTEIWAGACEVGVLHTTSTAARGQGMKISAGSQKESA